jgi:hypothetical protein
MRDTDGNMLLGVGDQDWAGGILNSFFALFHHYPGYQIYKIYGATDAYPLMRMLNTGCSNIIRWSG